MYTYGHWKCNFKIDFKKTVSFVYQINIMNHHYIGFKNLYSKVYDLPIPVDCNKSNWEIYTSSSVVLNHLIKNGNNAEFIILKTFSNTSDAMSYERELLMHYDARNNEKFINNTNGFSLSYDELIDRDMAVSNSIKLLWKDETYRNKTIKGQTGRKCVNRKPVTDERRKQMSETGKKLWQDKEYYEKHVNRTRLAEYISSLTEEEKNQHYQSCCENNPYFQKGHKFTDEERKNMSLAARGKIISDETRKKLSAANKGKKKSKEDKENMSRIQRGITRHYVKEVIIDGISYKSYRNAGLLLNISPGTVKLRCLADDILNYIVIFKYPEDFKKNQPKKQLWKKCIIIDGVIYNSITEASKITGECSNSISRKVHSDLYENYNIYNDN